MPARPEIRGLRTGRQLPDEHLWLLFSPRGDVELWWAFQKELVPDADGVWVVTEAEIGGPPGSRHTIAVAAADETAHASIQRYQRDRPGAPFQPGLPGGLRVLTRITIEKGP